MTMKSPRFLTQKVKGMQKQVAELQKQLTNARKMLEKKNVSIAQHHGELKKQKTSYAILKAKIQKYSSNS